MVRRRGAGNGFSGLTRTAAGSSLEGMYLIVVKFPVRPESVDQWPQIVADYTRGVREEEGNLFFEWSRSLEDPHEFVLVEGFTNEGAGAHVESPHFSEGIEAMRPHLAATPQIISRQVEGDGWDAMGELRID